MSERDEAIDAMREACAGWPQPNHYDRALDYLVAELEQAEKEQDRLREFLAEIESFPVSGYHAAQAQQMARAALGEAKQ